MLRKNPKNKDEKILALETRKKIYEIVRKNSGCHFREIERRSSIPHGTLKYHLNFLSRHNLIINKKENNNLRYFPKDFQTENIQLLSFLRQTAPRKIILFLVLNEKSNNEEISKFVNLSQSTVSWHISKLAKDKIISSEKIGNRTKYKLEADKNEIIKLLIIYKESFLDSLVNKVIESWEQ